MRLAGAERTVSTAPLVNRLGLLVWTARSERSIDAKRLAKSVRLTEREILDIERGDTLPDDALVRSLAWELGLDPDVLVRLRASDQKAQDELATPAAVPASNELPDVAGIWYVPAALGRPYTPVLKLAVAGRVAGIFGGDAAPVAFTRPPPKEKP